MINNAQIANLITTFLQLIAGFFVSRGVINSNEAETLISAVAAIVVFIVTHNWHSTPSGPSQKMPSPLLAFILIGMISVLMVGCSTAYKNGCVTTVQNRFFGIQVTTASSSSAAPSVLFGAGSSLVTIYPTSTNALYCAPFFSTASGNTTANPFDVTINETIGAGNVASAISTNGTSSSTIIPKLSKPTPPTPPTAPTSPSK